MSEYLRTLHHQLNQEIMDSAHIVANAWDEAFTPYEPAQVEAERQQAQRLGANVVTVSGAERTLRAYDARLQTGVSLTEVMSLDQRVDCEGSMPWAMHSIAMTWQDYPNVEAQINLDTEHVLLVRLINGVRLQKINLHNYKSPLCRARILGGLAAAADTVAGF